MVRALGLATGGAVGILWLASVVAAADLPPGAIALRFQGFEGSLDDTWTYTTSGTTAVVSSRWHSGIHSLALNSTQAADPSVTFGAVPLVPHRPVFLSIAYSALGPDSDDDLFLELAYHGGVTWTGTGSVKLVDGWLNADLAFGATHINEPATVPANPYVVSLPGDSTQVQVRVRFNAVNGSGSLDSYFIDDVTLYTFPSNLPPRLRPVTNQVALVGQTLTLPIVAEDWDGDVIGITTGPLPANAQWMPGTGAGIATGVVVFTPAEGQAGAVYTLGFQAQDKDGVVSQSVAVAVQRVAAYFVSPRAVFTEDGGTQFVSVALSRAADLAVIVRGTGTAEPGVDYHLPPLGRVLFTSEGPTEQAIPVRVVNDALAEGPESLVLTFLDQPGVTAPPSNRCEILLRDDDSFTLATANLTAGGFRYRDASTRLLQALGADIVALQEFNVTNAGGHRAYVDEAIGTNFHFYVESNSLPNGVASRWPIVAAGEWPDPFVTGRGFVWATIDLPGPRHLNVVSVHFAADTFADRFSEAAVLTNALAMAPFSTNDWLAVLGDLNTPGSTLEDALPNLATVVSDLRVPVDQFGDADTSDSRNNRYDYILPDFALDAQTCALRFGGETFPSGMVFDTRLWPPDEVPFPALPGDSGTSGLQHEPVMKAFSLLRLHRLDTVVLGRGSVVPSWALLNDGESVTFTVTPGVYAYLAAARTNGTSLDVEASSAMQLVTWSNVAADGLLAVEFRDILASKATPQWWLAAHGWETNFDVAEDADPDGDGARNWEEWQADTDPHAETSVLRVVTVASEAPWQVSYPSSSKRLYTLQRADDLVSGPWSNVAAWVDVAGSDGLQTVSISNAVWPGFFRLGVRLPD